jgi:methionyl-tRNA formyltransferase
MRAAFLGNAPWSVPSLEALAESSHQVILVGTRTPRPAGRGTRVVPTPVADAARRLGLSLMETETVKAGPGFEALSAAAPDVLAVVAYGEILPPAVLDLPAVAPVNLHFSLLPELRGAAPVQRAILEGMTVTGVTTIRMDPGMDTGPILLRGEEAIDPRDDAGSLGDRLAILGAHLLVDTLDRLEAGGLEPVPQDEAAASYAPKLIAADRVIRWEAGHEEIVRRVRALAPAPSATTTFRGRALKVFRAEEVDPRRLETNATGKPGAIAVATAQGLAVAAGRGGVELVEVAPEGRRRMSGAEFVRGYRPKVGETLG